MRVVYYAEDGTAFEDKYKCEEYEFLQEINPPLLSTVFFGVDKKPITGIFSFISDDLYNTVQCIYVPTIEAVEALHKVARFAGHCMYTSIKEPGFWQWETVLDDFIKVEGKEYAKNMLLSVMH